jgi:superfamily II DNA or RNA helicase
MAAPVLRDYQEDFVGLIRGALRSVRSVVGVLQTGGGKTVCFSKIASGVASRGKTVWILAHRKEIISQISMSISRFDVRHQVVANDKTVRRLISRQYLERGESFVVPVSNVVVASVQTLVNRIGSMPLPDYMIVDECHHVTPGSSWGRVVAANPAAKIIGVTATPCRLDGKGLGLAAGGYFEELVEGVSAAELIERGFLCRYRVYTPGNVDVSGLRKRGGDFSESDLESLVDKPGITGDVVLHYQRICGGDRAVVFGVSVRHAQHVCDAFLAGGVPAAVLTGEMDEDARNDVLEAYTEGRILVLCTVDIVSEGFDLPAITAVILLRPTASFSLYRQQVGRVLRIFHGKEWAYIIDHVGNWDRHGPPDAEVAWSLDGVVKSPRETGEQAEPMKVCPKCFYVHDPSPICPGCGHVYQTNGRELKERGGVLVELTKEEIAAAKEKAKAAKKKAVYKAKTLEELQAIAEKFGYSPGWAEHTFRARRQVEARYRKQSRY